uniref:DNA polymerase beta n=1 Tax=viral metagenome TaxID=1070528 RepID=A0A6C0I337_9ZZZZ
MERKNEIWAKQLDELSQLMMKKGEVMRSRAYTKAKEAILTMGDVSNVDQLKGIRNIGPSVIEKISEFESTGRIHVIDEERARPENIFTDIFGIGPKKAKELVEKGIVTLEQLREGQKELLNSTQQTGLKYYDDIMERIPRSEIDEYKTILDETFETVRQHGDDRYEIVGSYRRGSADSGDIDVIVTSTDKKIMGRWVTILKEVGIIREVLSQGASKALLITRLHGNSRVCRRVDLLYTTHEEYPFSVLYFTGSKDFNTIMRYQATLAGYSLNEYGITNKITGEKVDRQFKDEKDIFDFLYMKYKLPNERIDGRAVVLETKPHDATNSKGEPVAASPGKKKGKKTLKVVATTPKEVVPVVASPGKKKGKKTLKLVAVATTPKEVVATTPKEVVPVVASPGKKKGKKTIKLVAVATTPKEVVATTPKEVVPVVASPGKKKGKKTLKLVAVATPPLNTSVGSGKKKEKPTRKKELKTKGQAVSTEQMITDFKQNGIGVLEVLSEDQLVSMVTLANDTYYNTQTTLLTDNEYDILKEFIERKFPKNAVLKDIGAPVEKNKVTLPYEMASMDKIKPDTNALSNWKQKYVGPYVLSCKLDGVSGLYSTEGDVPRLYTRGNGIVGQDITHILRVLNLPTNKGIVVRGEFIIPKAVFDSKYASQFANPRNLVAGMINSKTMDAKIHDLHFVAYELIQPHVKPSEQLETLTGLGFEVVQFEKRREITNESLSETLLDWRSKYAYEIDGVIVANDAIYARKSGNPDHAFAFKMVISDQMAEAKVVDVIWTPSKLGYLKPRVRIEPVRLSGVTIEYATGFNGAFIESNKIGIGSIIQIIRSGDVIPHIRSVTVPAEVAKMPTVPYHWNETHVDIVLDDVAGDDTVREKNVTDFFKTIEVDGLSGGNVKRIIAAGFDTVPKILHMSKTDFESVSGFKAKMVEKIYQGIQDKVAAAPLLAIMAGSNLLGRGIGERKMKPILDAFPNILLSGESPSQKETMLRGVSGIGAENARAFVANIPAFLAFLEECGLLEKLTQKVVSAPTISIVEHVLNNKHIVMTKVRDKTIIDALARYGATLDDGIGKHTFVLVVKSKEDVSNKTKYAEQHGIPMMTPEEFIATYLTDR